MDHDSRRSATNPIGWEGSALIRPGVLAFTGSIGQTERHSHHAVQVMTAPTRLSVADHTGNQRCGSRIILPSNVSHRITAGAPKRVAAFLEPDSDAGRAAEQRAHALGWVDESASLRRYILWLRLSRAIAHTAAGHNLTESAHAAGFSDSAHLTRTCRAAFGMPPRR
ncbi:helix-turn-helix domain-containing protein [Nocardia sp. NBC_01377]|uniref:helix-turn-helix domain-containing protein n=1 Tax=Nocardia sp. NBC_01377 TaxID=2903595 RepID=UPI00324665E1